jgi:hypothetical protein
MTSASRTIWQKIMPEKVEKLKKMLYNWRRKVNAQILTPNPNYDYRKAKKSGMRKK